MLRTPYYQHGIVVVREKPVRDFPHYFNKCDRCGYVGRAKITSWLKKRWWNCPQCLNMRYYP